MSIQLGLLVETAWSWVTRVKRLRPLWRLRHACAQPLGAPSPPSAAQPPPASVEPLGPSLLSLGSVARQPRVSVRPLAAPSRPAPASAVQPRPVSVEPLGPSLLSLASVARQP